MNEAITSSTTSSVNSLIVLPPTQDVSYISGEMHKCAWLLVHYWYITGTSYIKKRIH